MAMKVVGKKTPRIEGPDKVSGTLHYSADMAPDGVIWGRVLRSPYAHAKINRIDTSKAVAMTGVYAVVTGSDHPHWMGRTLRDLPVLAIDKVRFIGERVVAVAAESLDIADKAISLIEVDYEELPAALNVTAATATGAPVVHEDPSSYANAFRHPESPDIPNLCSYGRWTHGDIDQAFAKADQIFEHTFRTPKEHHGYMETHACVVSVASDGTAEVWASNKSPHLLRGQIAAAMNVEQPTSIKVYPMPVGGDFGGKGSPMDAPLAYLLSRESGRPVKIVMTYQEELLAANSRHPSTITVKSGIKNDGRVLALQLNAVFDGGAYGAFKPAPNVNLHGLEQAGSCYKFEATDTQSTIIYTNTLPAGHMRSPGGPQVNFAVESHLNIVANEMGFDPGTFRMQNLLEQGDTAPNGDKWGTIIARETLQAAMDKIGWGEPLAPNTGRGISMYERGPIGGDSSCRLTLHQSGTVTIEVPIADPGQGAYTAIQQIAAEALGTDTSDIAIKAAPTSDLPFDIGVSGSRVTFALGVTVTDAIEQLQSKMKELAGDASFKRAAAELLRDEGQDVVINAYRQIPIFPDPPSTEFTAQIAEVEVDPETGNVLVKRLVTAHDIGTIVNPVGHQGQIEGGAIQGFGFGMMSEHLLDGGKPLALSLADYKIPNIQDIPELETVLVQRADGPGPFNAGAIAESSNVPTASAIANAVSDAIGQPIYEIPLSAERIYSLIQGTQP